MTERGYTWRVLLVTLTVLFVWIGLGARLAFLHVGPTDDLHDRVDRIRKMEKEILGRRGRVLDREGNILALDLAVKNVCADPKVIVENGQVSRISSYLAHMLEVSPAMVLARINRPHRRFEYIKRYVHEDLADQINRMQLDGVFMREDSARNYPLGSMMCHVIGFSNLEGDGSAGVEQAMNKFLKGRPGLRVGQLDGKGRELYNFRALDIEPQRGADVYLTIDQKLQYFVEKALDDAMEEHSAKGAWAIMQRVKTGEILAMASRPSYDLNDFRNAKQVHIRNGSLAYVYEPGSTLKGVVLASALNDGVVSPSDVIDCEGGYWTYGRRGLRDYHAYDDLTVADVLKKSSNIGMAKIGLKMGEQRLADCLDAFGLGKKSGINLPGEEAGIFHPVDKWSAISITRLTMGHEIAVTGLQILNAYCALANDGFLMRPYVVEKVVDDDGMVLMEVEPMVLNRPIRQETSRTICKLLSRVTQEGGTARRAAVEGYTVAGKTGTAQKPIPGGYSDTDHFASFVGFIPAEQPEIGIVVVVDGPQPKHTGGVVAGPVFREIAEQAVRYLDIPPVPASPELMLSQSN